MVLGFSRPSRGSPRCFGTPFAPCAAPASRSRLRVLARPRRRARRILPPACWRVARRTRPRRPPLTWRPRRLVLARMASTTGSAIACTTSVPATPPPRPATSCCCTASAWAPSTTRRSSPPSRTRARACGRSTSSTRAPRGHPRRGRGAGVRYSVDTWRDQVEHFLLERVRAPAFLAGNSLGGYIATYVAATAPDLCAGLVLMNATFWAFLPADPTRREGASP